MARMLASRDTDVHGLISFHLCRSVSGEARICVIRVKTLFAIFSPQNTLKPLRGTQKTLKTKPPYS